MNKIWLELERDKDAATNHERARLANNMIKRLVDPIHVHADMKQFSYDEPTKRYHYGNNMGFLVLSDNGEWFNLDYFGRD